MAKQFKMLDEEKQINNDTGDIVLGATWSRRDLSSRESNTDYYESDKK